MQNLAQGIWRKVWETTVLLIPLRCLEQHRAKPKLGLPGLGAEELMGLLS